jgi:hypothetical protein
MEDGVRAAGEFSEDILKKPYCGEVCLADGSDREDGVYGDCGDDQKCRKNAGQGGMKNTADGIGFRQRRDGSFLCGRDYGIGKLRGFLRQGRELCGDLFFGECNIYGGCPFFIHDFFPPSAGHK